MGLRVTKRESETWKQAIIRYTRGSRYIAPSDVLNSYELFRREGQNEANAAYSALSEWDMLDSVDEDGDTMPDPDLDIGIL